MQIVLTAALFISLPIWKGNKGKSSDEKAPQRAPLSLREVFRIQGAKEVAVAFFCYCAVEQTAGLWASSYFVLKDGLDKETAASFASLFFIGITVGRAISGFLTYKLNDTAMIRLGQGILMVGILVMNLPFGYLVTVIGLLLIGLGCAPIYPCVIHSTPAHFGEENSQALIGVQMASAYVGVCAMPPLFGLIANHISTALLPAYLAIIAVVMIVMCEKLNRKSAARTL
jgi:fucose permease